MRSLESFEGTDSNGPPEEVAPFLLWEVKVPSKSMPGRIYTVRAWSDGYECDCPGRKVHLMCHHVAGAILMMENKLVKPEKYRGPRPPRPRIKKHDEMMGLIKEYNLRENTRITFDSPMVQDWMGKAMRIVFNTIIQNPGITRRDIPARSGVHYNTIGKAVIDLIDMGLIREDGVDDSTGNPRAKLYPNEEIIRI